jgi:GAF domain-containing protein
MDAIDLRQPGRELTSLYETARDLAALREVNEVLAAIVRRSHALMAADLTYLQVYDEATGAIRTRASEGVVTKAFRDMSVPHGAGIARRAIEDRLPRWVRNYRESDIFSHSPSGDEVVTAEGVVAVLAVPMVAGNRVGGVLYAAFRYERDFRPDEVALLAAFADHAAVALENARLFEESRQALDELRMAYTTIQQQVAAADRVGALHAAMTEVVLHGGNAGDIADVLASSLDGHVAVFDRSNRMVVERGSGPQVVQPFDRATLDAIGDSRRTGRAVLLDPVDGWYRQVLAVMADGIYLGCILRAAEVEIAATDMALIERAGQITALVTLIRDARVDAEERVRGELLSELLGSNRAGFSSGLLLRAQARQVNLKALSAVAVVVTEDGPARDVIRVLHDLAGSEGGLAGEHLGHLTLLSVGKQPAAELGRSVVEAMRRALGRPMLVAISPIRSNAAGELDRAFQLAWRCAQLSKAIGLRGKAVTTDEMGLYSMVFDPERSGELQDFVRGTVGPLLEHDASSGTVLASTLTMYFENSCNQSKTARAMDLHVNTLAKRMERIDAVLGADWRRGDRQLQVQFALRLNALAAAM